MESTVQIAPTLIYRAPPGKIELAGLEHRGEWAALVFMSPEQAEEFRGKTGSYPESEGFRVTSVDAEELRVIIGVWEYKYVALRGPETDTVSYLESDDFIGMLEESVE